MNFVTGNCYICSKETTKMLESLPSMQNTFVCEKHLKKYYE